MSTLLSTPLAGALRTAASIALGTGLLCLAAAFNSQDTRTRPSADKAYPRSFTMGEAVRFAMEHNETLGASEAQMRASEEGRKAQRGYLGPKLGTTYS